MFSGIVESLGNVLSVEDKDGGALISIKTSFNDDIKVGDSVCVNGVCLTVARIYDRAVFFNIINETIKKTNLLDVNINSCVNLERSLQYNERISGHLVQGHVESTGKITNIENVGSEEVRFSIELDEGILKYCVYKGSITIDGISLTIASVLENVIQVAIVPHTFKTTNLSFKKVNDRVNIETDMIAKYVENILISKGE